MFNYLQIDGDPTKWWLDQPIDASNLAGQTPRFQVKAPLVGTLLLSPRSAASVAVFDLPSPTSPPGEGSVPHDVKIPIPVTLDNPVIYVPTATGPSAGSVGYELPAFVVLADLADQIAALMRDRSSQAITLGDAASGGVLMLNGAMLSFVVLCPAASATGVLNDPSGGGSVPHD